jgi:hypothetical protein
MSEMERIFEQGEVDDDWGKIVFRGLLVIIPLGAVVAIFWLAIGYPVFLKDEPVTVPMVTTVTEVRSATPGAASSIVTTTMPITNTGTMGIFDPSLSSTARPNLFLMGTLIFILSSIIETSLLLVYGAFYVNSRRHADEPLGLPPGTVRIFILILVTFVLIVFAMLPSAWGDNKAVVLLFGLLSSVVGFYFGSGAFQEGAKSVPSTSSQTTTTPAITPGGDVVGTATIATTGPSTGAGTTPATAVVTPPAVTVEPASADPTDQPAPSPASPETATGS